ncbi:MAG: SusD/RagB family nutrient-binding outer membrane lipoprotein [Gemmatimonadota bacterium]|nr:MAG: SusD/RagB family nutrient-binding outer membrane lipoprotein [Gemmatimonadota bacterium]
MGYRKWIRFAVAAGLLAGWTAACDFVEPTDSNPNSVPDATVDQLFVSAQINAWFFSTGDLSRHISVWVQQMGGTDRQFTGIEEYSLTETDLEPEWSRVYGSGEARASGGLLDLRKAQAAAEARGSRVYAGILKIHEAYLIGMAASFWGDIPYSQAANIEEFPTPELDEQAAVYADVQALLDEAIADIDSGEEFFAGEPGDFDMVFGGDPDAWRAVAFSLKARFYMHWAEVDPGNYDLALAAAQDGIADAAGNWRSVHSLTLKESNLWYQFNLDRSGYVSSGNLVFDLDADSDGQFTPGDDPRLPLYFNQVEVCPVGLTCPDDQAPDVLYIGSPPGTGSIITLGGVDYEDPGADASQLMIVGQADYGHQIVTCAENQLIIAEAEYNVGTEANAQAALQAALDCQEAFWASQDQTIDLGAVDPGLTGQALLEEIMTQKYRALLLNVEAWNDYKRTCLPALTPAGGESALIARLFYAQAERETNPNIPAPGSVFDRNDNDPAACPLP